MKDKNLRWITMAELFVVVFILSILATLIFIALSRYSVQARNSARATDIDTIIQSLEICWTKASRYPFPTDWVEVTYSWWELWTQWVIWESMMYSLENLAKEYKDPLTKTYYSYSRLNTRREYEVWAVMEEEWENLAYIRWTYNRIVVLLVNTGSVDYILTIPNITSSNLDNTDIVNLQENGKLSFHESTNLPDSYKNTVLKSNWLSEEFTLGSILAYTWRIRDLSETENQIKLLKKLQEIYTPTKIWKTNHTIKTIVDLEIDEENPSLEAKLFIQKLIKRWIKANIIFSEDAESCSE